MEGAAFLYKKQANTDSGSRYAFIPFKVINVSERMLYKFLNVSFPVTGDV